MNTVSKQDGVYPRTPSALAQQYDFGKVFDEITGIKLTVAEQEAMMEAELSLKLGYDDNDRIVSMLNASANIITIRGNRLTIESDHFDVTADGTVYARAGEIGGCIIKDGVLQIKAINIVDQLTADQIDTQQFDRRVSEVETSLTIVSGQIESKVSQTDFDALGNTVSTHETKITQLPDQILSEVSATYATQDALTTGIASAESKITQTASEIRSEVSATYATKNEIPDTEDIEDRLRSAESAITQMPNEILSTVSGTYATKDEIPDTEDIEDRLLSAESKIDQMPNEILFSVEGTYATIDGLNSVSGQLDMKIGRDENDQIVSMLNASANMISISSDRFKLTGSEDGVWWENGHLQSEMIHATNALTAGDLAQYNYFQADDSGVYIGSNIILRNEDPDGTTIHKGVIRCDEIILSSLMDELGIEINAIKERLTELEERIA